MKHFVVLLLLLSSAFAAAQMYRWVDSNGRIQVGPVAPAQYQAERIDLAPNSAAPMLPQQQPVKSASKTVAQPVVMYATSWCGFCRKARAYFKEQGIAYIEFDIEKDKAAYQRYKNLGGRGVPVISVGEKTIFGFSPKKFEAIYPRPAQPVTAPN